MLCKRFFGCETKKKQAEKRLTDLGRLFIRIYEDKSSGKRWQSIRISYDLVGFISVDELIDTENGMTEVMPSLQNTMILF